MDVAQFTPGPWAVHPRFAYIVPLDHAERPIGGAEDDAYDLAHYAQEICALHHPDRHRSEIESKANAHLIAAAPDLLEALENLVDAVRFDVDKVRRLARAEDAIARAIPPKGSRHDG